MSDAELAQKKYYRYEEDELIDNVNDIESMMKQSMAYLDDVDGMAEHLRMLLADDAIRTEMGQNARSWVVGEFSLEQLARKTESVYLDALNRKPAGTNRVHNKRTKEEAKIPVTSTMRS